MKTNAVEYSPINKNFIISYSEIEGSVVMLLDYAVSNLYHTITHLLVSSRVCYITIHHLL